MARFSPDPVSSGPAIHAIVGHGFRIDDRLYPEGVMLDPKEARVWHAPALDGLDPAGLASLLARDPAPEFLLLGTGALLRRPPVAFIRAVEAMNIGVEVMDSRAAARAWGVLRAEGREIVAALMPLDR